ncbi:hypothetical protein PF004_g16825 [Phytophthora fragariae]|uniref:Uncharacterized protein n=1 Tax=Phytophthora fragariae TaxID=53985 RepID=A0A6G0NH95_9STRA|nr:hypothetical protein PF004_g16825 [Phytophthora fragariae]
MEDTNPGAGSTLDDVSGVFLTEARIANGKFPLREINDMEPVVSGISQMSQSTLLLKKRKEMREIDDALDFMKEEYAQRMEACDARQRELERKQAEMKEQVTRFEKFIKENDSKRTRAELKCKSEHRLGEINEARKRQLVMQLEKDGREREALERKRDQLLKYRLYLEAAVEASDGEYEEIGDILNRHATLVDTNNDLKAQVRAAEVETDQLRQRIRALKVEMQNLVLVQNSSIHGQQQQLETLRSEALRLDLDRQRNDRVANDRSRESGQIVLTVTNLYSRLNLGEKLPVLREQDMDVAQYIQSLLKVIASRIVDLDYIVSNYKDQSAKAGNNNSASNNTSNPSGGNPGTGEVTDKLPLPKGKERQNPAKRQLSLPLPLESSRVYSQFKFKNMSTNPDSGHSGTPPPPPLPSFAADGFLSSAGSPPYSRNTGRSPGRRSGDRSDEMDVMAQLASQYYASSRNRSFSAPIQPSALGSAWNSFADDTSVSAAAAAAATQRHQIQMQMQGQSLRPHQPPLPQGPPPPVLNIMVPPPPSDDVAVGAIGQAVQSLQLSSEENSETGHIGDDELTGAPLPATFLRTICDQLEYYFCDENLLGDLFLLKNMNMDGYVKLDLLASFGRVKKLTTDMEQIKKALELSTKLLLNEDESMVCRKEPLAPNQTYHGKLARTAIAYNLPEDASVASLRETFQGCGEISYLRLLKKNTTTGRNAVLKPPIAAGETYAIIEFVDDEMTKHAVLTLSDQYNWRTGMQVVLFDGTNCDKLKQKMFPVELGGDRRRAKSASALTRPVHVESVGEGLDDLREGKVNTGTVYSIRGAGGLITPTRQDSACISFRLIPDEDGNVDIRQGDYVSFTVGKNKKSGRKYASKVKLEFRPPANLTGDANNGGMSGLAALSGGSSSGNGQKDYFAPSPSRWESRSRAATVGAPPQPAAFRARSSSSGTRPKLNLSSPRMAQSPVHNSNNLGSNALAPPPGMGLNGSNQLYRQAIGPDGTRGFGFRRTGGEPPEMAPDLKFPVMERRRSRSSGGAW